MNLSLPEGMALVNNPYINGQEDEKISLLAKGKRYGFAQEARYSTLLN
jgi:hypothetical protein